MASVYARHTRTHTHTHAHAHTYEHAREWTHFLYIYIYARDQTVPITLGWQANFSIFLPIEIVCAIQKKTKWVSLRRTSPNIYTYICKKYIYIYIYTHICIYVRHQTDFLTLRLKIEIDYAIWNTEHRRVFGQGNLRDHVKKYDMSKEPNNVWLFCTTYQNGQCHSLNCSPHRRVFGQGKLVGLEVKTHMTRKNESCRLRSWVLAHMCKRVSWWSNAGSWK